MKTYDERTADVRKKIAIKKRNRRIVTGSCLSLVVILTLVLFVPYSTTPPDVSGYQNSEYYDLIRILNEVTYEKPKYANNFEALMASLPRFSQIKGEMAPDNMDIASGMVSAEAEEYVEVTDNQVQGVTEGDIFKRSDKYIYYLAGGTLHIYSIDAEKSVQVGMYNIGKYTSPNGEQSGWHWRGSDQMYLSEDCTTVTVIQEYYLDGIGVSVVVADLDVTNPQNVLTRSYVCFPGSIVSTRMVEDQLLLTYNYQVNTVTLNFEEPETYVPSYGVPGDMKMLSAENILCPDNAASARYTVVCSLDRQTLEVRDSLALMDYSQELYVSPNAIYATHNYMEKSDKIIDRYTQTAMTEITGISFDGALNVLGGIQLEGNVKDQYSVDEYDGILRVVTSTEISQVQEWVRDNTVIGLDVVSLSVINTERNVNLYCVDLSDWSVAVSVIGFAPEGEEATSVRFDGVNAYVCTAERITLSDPVYFFDLSDLQNITWTDTGVIDGYSTSLINMGEGYLLGIGYGDLRQLKIEVYEQTRDGVVSVSAWEKNAEFSEVYKSYFIDRERDLVGLAVRNDWSGGCYVLLHFDGYKLQEVLQVDLEGSLELDSARAFLADGYFYILERSNGLIVEKAQ